MAAVGLALLGTWVWTELVARQPLVDMRVMRLRPVWTTNLVALLLGAGMYSSFIVLPQFVETPASTGFAFGASVTAAGLFMVPSTVAMLLVGPMAGRLEARSDPAYGINTITRTVGGAFGGQVVASIIAANVIAGEPSEHGFTVAFVIIAASLVLSLVVGLAIPRPGSAAGRMGPGELAEA